MAQGLGTPGLAYIVSDEKSASILLFFSVSNDSFTKIFILVVA